MADVVMTEPAPVTVGHAPRSTFLAAATLELPDRYAILRPGRAGYVLTLSTRMGGTLSIQGRTIQVADFVAESAGTGGGSFRATAVKPGDWGVIHLDGAGEHTLFFQFVETAAPLPRSGWRDSEMILPAAAFSVFLHAAFVIYAMWIFSGEGTGFTFPGNRDLVVDYLVNRPAAYQPPETPEPKAGVDDGEEKVEAASTVGKEAKKGGEGDEPRRRAPDPDKGEPDEPLPKSIRRGLLIDKSREAMRAAARRGGFDEKLGKANARLRGLANNGGLMGFGDGTGTGIGTGKGTGTTRTGSAAGVGGGGTAHADVETRRRLDTGGKRAARGLPSGTGVKETKVSVKTGSPGGDLGGLTKAQILKVVLSRKGAIRTCYERQLQRTGGLGGKIIVYWKINAGGSVIGAKVLSTTMKSGPVEDCIVRQVARLRFPNPRGGATAKVKFPFVFAQR
jgi:hypothetical protein